MSRVEELKNCLGCFHWKRNSDYWGECDNRQGVMIEEAGRTTGQRRAKLITREDFCCVGYSKKFRSTATKIVSQKVEPQNPWDQGGDVHPVKVH